MREESIYLPVKVGSRIEDYNGNFGRIVTREQISYGNYRYQCLMDGKDNGYAFVMFYNSGAFKSIEEDYTDYDHQ